MTAERRLIVFFQKVDLNALNSMKNTKFLTVEQYSDNGAKNCEPKKKKEYLGGFEPATFWFVARRRIHYANPFI